METYRLYAQMGSTGDTVDVSLSGWKGLFILEEMAKAIIHANKGYKGCLYMSENGTIMDNYDYDWEDQS